MLERQRRALGIARIGMDDELYRDITPFRKRKHNKDGFVLNIEDRPRDEFGRFQQWA
jgi:hypothetical protein